MENPFEGIVEQLTIINNRLITIEDSLIEGNNKNSIEQSAFIPGKAVEKELSISRTTRWNWTKRGILKQYEIGGKKLYKREEVMRAAVLA